MKPARWTNKQTNEKKGINKEMHGVRACKYDTKFYLISLPRDTTPKFIHRWFIHTISSLAFNRIPLSTRRICQLSKPNGFGFGLEKYIVFLLKANQITSLQQTRQGGQTGRAEAYKQREKSGIPFTLHISSNCFFFFLHQHRFFRLSDTFVSKNKWSTHFDCLSLVCCWNCCVLRESFRFSTFNELAKMKVISFKWIDTNVKYFAHKKMLCISINAMHRIEYYNIRT